VRSLFPVVAFGLVLLYAGLLLMMWWYQERIVFQPPQGVEPTPVPARRVSYHSADGIELFAYVVGDCEADGTLMLAFHGNADLARFFVPWAATVSRVANVCVMIPEYRGYDGVAGVPTYSGSARDALAAYEYARDSLHVPPARMVLFGHSLGSAIAAELTSVVTPRSLVLQSPFSTARAMAARMFLPGLTLFWRFVSRVHFDTLARVRALRAPVWVAHGDRDIIIPVRMGRDVFAAAAERGELLIVGGAGHNDVAEVGGREYWSWIANAVKGAPARAAIRDVGAETRSAP
jgi:fermentation-respiration switch protein FrsA (DUF1100 family)